MGRVSEYNYISAFCVFYVSEVLEDQRCCAGTVLTQEESRLQEIAPEQLPVTILDVPSEVTSIYNVLCCRLTGGEGAEFLGVAKIEFIETDVYPID